MRLLDEMQCKVCMGFGWFNRKAGHFVSRNRSEDEFCTRCKGSGYRDGVKLMDLIRAL